MKCIEIIAASISLLFFATMPVYGQEHANDEPDWKSISLNDLSAFSNPGKNWMVASDARGDYTKQGDLEKTKAGKGVVINHPSDKYHTHLVTEEQFGDIELSLDFMMAKGSNSGIYLQGRYEVQLFDSWTGLHPSFADCGGIYQRWDDSRADGHQGYEGIAPLQNACRAPGLWQHIDILFRAPRFDESGKKIANARFEKVYLNGVLVQDEVTVTGPTRSPWVNDEKPLGPLVLQGDHRQVAFRNIRYRTLAANSIKYSARDPIIITPGNHPYLQRSFMEFGGKKLTYVISLGDPSGLNYAYDLKQGALFQLWRGRFVDVTDMWYSRGEAQLAVPQGSVLPLSDAPFIAVLPDDHAAWPDSVAFDDLQDEGYVLDKAGIPTFSYRIKGINVKDKIAPAAGSDGFLRTIVVTDPPAGLYGRIVAAGVIERSAKELYRIDGSYYIRIDKHYKPQIRQTAQGQEMLVPLSGLKAPLVYSIIW